MTMQADEDGYAVAVLAKDEVKVYEWLHRQYDADPGEYRVGGRRLEYPPEHYADLGDMSADLNAETLSNSENVDAEEARVILSKTDDIMQKLADGLKRAGMGDDALRVMVDRGLDVNPYADDDGR